MVLVKKSELTLDLILSKIDEIDIFYNEIPNLHLGRAICSPLRNDKSPSFIVYMNEYQHIRYKDMANEDYQGGCVDFICQMYGLNYDKALRKIAQDFNILAEGEQYKQITSKYAKPVLDVKRHCLIQVKARKWDTNSIAYWSAYGISVDELRKENVYCVKDLYINHKKQHIGKNELAFCYVFDNGYKIYLPTRPKGEKWKSNIPITTVENINAIKDHNTILCTKSRKDRLLLSRYFPCVINVQNEQASNITPELADLLKEKKVLINYDSDKVGKAASMKITSMYSNFKHLNVPDKYLPQIKDYSDLYKAHGEQSIIEHFREKQII